MVLSMDLSIEIFLLNLMEHSNEILSSSEMILPDVSPKSHLNSRFVQGLSKFVVSGCSIYTFPTYIYIQVACVRSMKYFSVNGYFISGVMPTRSLFLSVLIKRFALDTTFCGRVSNTESNDLTGFGNVVSPH